MKKISVMFLLVIVVMCSFTACSKDDDFVTNIEQFVTVVNQSNADISVVVMDGSVYNFPSRQKFTSGDVEAQVVNAGGRNEIYFTKGSRSLVEKGWPVTVFVVSTKTLKEYQGDYTQIPHSGIILTAKPANWTLTYPGDFR